MRIRLIIDDNDYCSALKNILVSSNKDIYVELGSKGIINRIDDSTVIVTDVNSNLVDKRLFERTLFLTNNPDDRFDENEHPYKVFKYKNSGHILAAIEELNFIRTGNANNRISSNSRIYAVCGNMANRSSEICKALARQIVFRHGGEILILSMRYINEYTDEINDDSRNFSRMMYYIKTDRKFSIDAFTYSDSYGISYLILPSGINPTTSLKKEELFALIKMLSLEKFETVIIDIADCLNEKNIWLMKKADNILFIDDGKKYFDIQKIIGEDAFERCNAFKLRNQDKTLELQIDDYIKKIYWS